ncbi:helix-turn-helix transcriptional regulator, partial [Streptococcus agalactiae]|uniref:helix-turn-helix transcriptional regulator n=2 Tax=Bacteria TaxID=2 RepID=UPI00178C2CBE
EVAIDATTRAHLESAQHAAEQRHKLHIRYRDLKDQTSERVVRPLACTYWGRLWTLTAWCESREDFRTFRVDRIEHLEPLN